MPYDPVKKREYYLKNRDRVREYYLKNRDKILAQKQVYRDQIFFGGNKQLVLNRSNGKCIKCGADAEIIHHIDNDGFHSVDWLDRWVGNVGHDPNRMVALCKICHNKEHHKAEKMVMTYSRHGRWAMYHDKCIECGTTATPHSSHGRCENCRNRRRYRNKVKNA